MKDKTQKTVIRGYIEELNGIGDSIGGSIDLLRRVNRSLEILARMPSFAPHSSNKREIMLSGDENGISYTVAEYANISEDSSKDPTYQEIARRTYSQDDVSKLPLIYDRLQQEEVPK